jgi:hypothetical protein
MKFSPLPYHLPYSDVIRLMYNLYSYMFRHVGRCSSVGIVTCYWLDGPGIETRCWMRFSAPVQTGPATHPACYTMSTGSFPGVKRPERVVDHPTSSRTEFKERAIYVLHFWAFVVCYRVNFTYALTLHLLLPSTSPVPLPLPLLYLYFTFTFTLTFTLPSALP